APGRGPRIDAAAAAVTELAPGRGPRIDAAAAAVTELAPGRGPRIDAAAAAVTELAPGRGPRIDAAAAAVTELAPGRGPRIDAAAAAVTELADDDVWAVGGLTRAIVLHRVGDAFVTEALPDETPPLAGVSCEEGGAVWVSGFDGALLSRMGGLWRAIPDLVPA